MSLCISIGSTEIQEKKQTEIRAYIKDVQGVKDKLNELGSELKGQYSFQDYIYQPKEIEKKFDLNKEFIRVRAYSKTNWNQKAVELIHKIKSVVHAEGSVLLKKEFDTIDETQSILNPDYALAFSFKREGTEYSLNNLRLFIENIEGLRPSIEIVGPSHKEIQTLFDQLEDVEILSDSVPKLIEDQKVIKT